MEAQLDAEFGKDSDQNSKSIVSLSFIQKKRMWVLGSTLIENKIDIHI